MLVLFFVLVNLCFSQNDPATDGTQWTSIYASDFSGGTYRIKTAGYYRLMEDVWFDAKSPSGTQTPYDAYTMSPADFTSNGGPYDDLQYQVGFWAAITIESDHVTIDLNGHWIGQAPGHNLMNRFFNVIELGNQPFISGQGFANFGPVGSLARDSLVPSNSITIQNGGIGRSATNGIHGIGNKNILIENVAFRDFETSAVSLYGADTVVITRCSASSSKNVPVSAHFFTALQMRPYINFLAQKNPSYTLTVAGTAVAVSDIQNSLKNVINDVYATVITNQRQLQNSPGSETAASLFRNDWGRPDGNCFAFGTMGRNLDTVGFPFGYTEFDQPSTNVNITFSGIYDLECAPLEVVALTSRNDLTPIGVTQVPVVDARGQVFSLLQMNYDATQRNMATSVPVAVSFGTAGDVTTVSYVGNAVTNAQAIVGKAILQGVLTTSASGLEVRRSTFNADLLAWIAASPGSAASPLSSYINPSNTLLGTRGFICNGDESYKVQIGVNGIRIAGTWQFYISDIEAGGVRNYGLPGTTACSYTNTSRSIPTVVPGYGGAWARGVVLASTSNGIINNFYIRGLESYSGSVAAFDIVTDSANIVVEQFTIRDGWAASWVDSTDYGMYTDVPTPWPMSIGLHVDARATNVELVSYCANGIYSPFGEDYKISVGNSVVDGGEYENCHKGGEPWWVWLVLAIVCLIFILALVAIIMACMSGSGGDNTYQEMKNI